MTRRLYWIPGLFAALFLVGAAVGADEGTWQTRHGKAHQLHGKHAVFIGGDDATEFDLSELADGEVRAFGSGDKQVTVERNRDEVTITITHEKRGDGEPRSFTCQVGRDTCKVLTFDGDSEKVMIVVEQTRECHDGVGDCDLSVEVGAIAGGAAQVIIEELVDCGAAADCAKLVEVVIEGDPHDAVLAGEGHNVFLHRLGEDVRVLGLGGADHTVLRCPEGDATLSVAEEEGGDTFLCPKHSVPLERVSTPHRIRVIRSEKAHQDD